MVAPMSLSWLKASGPSVVLMAVGLGWLAYLVATSLTDPRVLLPASWPWLGAASALVLLSVAANGILFHLFLQPHDHERYPLSLALKLHYSSQLLRYLPGRLWGVVYQVSAAQGRIPALRIARANLDWMVFSLLGSGLISLLLMGYRQGWTTWGLIFMALVSVTFIGLVFLGGANWLLRLPTTRLPVKGRRMLHALADKSCNPRQLIQISSVFILSWMFYLSGWMLLAKVFPVFGQVDWLLLCAYYTLAAILGIASAITPAGLGVRESVFVILATGKLDTDAVAFFALFGRLWLMVLELILLAVPLVIFLHQRRSLR